MDTLLILDTAALLEDRLALLYHLFAQRYRVNPSGCAFWEGLSREEKKHADIVRTYRRQRLGLPMHRTDHPRLVRDLEEIVRFITSQLSVEQESIYSSLETAYHIEQLLAHAHLDRVREVEDPLLVRLLITLGNDDRLHQERIMDLSRSLQH